MAPYWSWKSPPRTSSSPSTDANRSSKRSTTRAWTWTRWCCPTPRGVLLLDGITTPANLRANDYPIFALDAHAKETIYTADLPERAAFVLGSETNGISDDVRPHVTGWLSIPMLAGVESLNVAGAAAVLCFEVVRRRDVAK